MGAGLTQVPREMERCGEADTALGKCRSMCRVPCREALKRGTAMARRICRQVDSERRHVEDSEFLRASVRPAGEKAAFEAQVFQRAGGAIDGLVFAETVWKIGGLVDQPGRWPEPFFRTNGASFLSPGHRPGSRDGEYRGGL